eukprot:4901957-Pleurochrysis_carterae.AAC.2
MCRCEACDSTEGRKRKHRRRKPFLRPSGRASRERVRLDGVPRAAETVRACQCRRRAARGTCTSATRCRRRASRDDVPHLALRDGDGSLRRTRQRAMGAVQMPRQVEPIPKLNILNCLFCAAVFAWLF